MSRCNNSYAPTLVDPRTLSGGSVSLWGYEEPVVGLGDFSWVPYYPPAYDAPDTIGHPDGAGNAPGAPAFDYSTPLSPYIASGGTITPVQVEDPPTLDEQSPDYVAPDKPGAFTELQPGMDVIDVPSVEDAPSVAISALPAISDPSEINAITIDDFDGIRPNTDITIPTLDISYDPGAYSDTILDETVVEIRRMLGGDIGIPDSVWQQIYYRFFDREEESIYRSIEEANTEISANGWSGFGGTLNKAIRDAQQRGQNARSAANREVMIKRADLEMESIKFAITQGVAAEQIYASIFTAVEDARYKAADLEGRLAIQFLQYQVAVINAQITAFQADAEIYRTVLETKVAQLDAEIKKESLNLEVDKTRLMVIDTEIKGLALQIDRHNSQISGVAQKISGEQLKFGKYSGLLNGYSEYVKLHGFEFDRYKTEMDGESIKGGFYKNIVQAHSEEIKGWLGTVEAEGIRVDAEIKTLAHDINRMTGDVQRFAVESQSEVGRLNVRSSFFDSEVRAHGSDVSNFGVKADLYKTDSQAYMENARAIASNNVEAVRMLAQQMEAIQTMSLSAEETIARVNGQIEASRIGQFSASTSDHAGYNVSRTQDCTES